jgi:hypothetical protein
VSSTSVHGSQAAVPSASVLPGETVYFHVSTTAAFGGYTISIRRPNGTEVTGLSGFPASFPASSGPLFRGRRPCPEIAATRMEDVKGDIDRTRRSYIRARLTKEIEARHQPLVEYRDLAIEYEGHTRQRGVGARLLP